jgi:hypothetical protein
LAADTKPYKKNWSFEEVFLLKNIHDTFMTTASEKCSIQPETQQFGTCAENPTLSAKKT